MCSYTQKKFNWQKTEVFNTWCPPQSKHSLPMIHNKLKGGGGGVGVGSKAPLRITKLVITHLLGKMFPNSRDFVLVLNLPV